MLQEAQVEHEEPQELPDGWYYDTVIELLESLKWEALFERRERTTKAYERHER